MCGQLYTTLDPDQTYIAPGYPSRLLGMKLQMYDRLTMFAVTLFSAQYA